MAGEDTESVGGISIEASVSNQLGGLGALETTLKSEATRLSSLFVINPTLGGLSAQVQQQHQQARRTAQQAAPIQFKSAALPTPAFGGRSTAAIDLINKKLAETGEILDELSGEPVPIASIQKATRATQGLAAAAGQVQQPTIEPTVDPAKVLDQFGALTGQVEALVAAISKVAVITPTVAPVSEAEVTAATKAAQAPTTARPPRPPRKPPTAVGTSGEDEDEDQPRRKKLVAKDIGTQPEDRVYTFGTGGVRPGVVEPGPAQRGQSYTSGETDIYAEQQALADALATRKREIIASASVGKNNSQHISQAEQGFIAAFQTAQKSPRFDVLGEEPAAAPPQAPTTAPAGAPIAGMRQRYVDAIAAVQRGESPLDPETGQPITAISQEHALRSLRQRMNVLGPESQGAPEVPQERRQPQPRPTAPTTGEQQPLGLTETAQERTERARRQRQEQDEYLRSLPPEQPYLLPDEREGARGTGRTTGRAPSRQTVEAVDEAAEARLARRLSTTISAPRTLRTGASGLGGIFLGGGRQRIADEDALTTAVQKRKIAERDVADASEFASRPEIRNNTKAYADATDDLAAARKRLVGFEREEASALQKVQQYSGLGSAARNLAGIATAGFALGLGLKAVDFAVSALTPAFGAAIDQASGFVAISNKTTVQLAAQTRAQMGNVDAVLAAAEANAGLSSSAADVIDSRLKLTAQIKAGALAAGEAGGLFRAAQGVGETPQGLLGGFGGLFNGPLLAQQLGGGAGLAETVESSFGDITGAIKDLGSSRVLTPDSNLRQRQFLTNDQQRNLSVPVDERGAKLDQLAEDLVGLQSTYNDAIERGAANLGVLSSDVAHFGAITKEQALELQATNLPDELKTLATESRIALRDATGGLIKASKAATDGLEQLGVGLSIPDLETFGRIALAQEKQRQRYAPAEIPAIQLRQQYERPSILAAAERQQQFALQVQQPAERALQNLTQPLAPVGTGIAPRNAQEQASISASLKESQGLQDDLNAGYAEGRAILATTYQVPLNLLNQIAATGKQIVAIQSGIANESAAYQTAQFNFQLMIARRTLSDIGGLTGKNFGAGESYLGVLERQNLALSRQAQLLSFSLAQRQINFQQALAGFQAPGVTPEERQANVKEAQIEAEFAQKQLDIQREMFGNQVQIVDISNLRQGADLAAQIGLLLQGRQLTIDTAAAQEQLALLQTKQSQLVGQAGTYLTKINALTGTAFSQIQQLEAAAGEAMVGIGTTVLSQFGIYIRGINDYVSQITSGAGSNSTTETQPGKLEDDQDTPVHAAGYVGKTSGATMTGVGWMGEAGDEAYAILRNPRQIEGLGGGSANVTIVFAGDINASEPGDLNRVTAAVISALGNRASLAGLRLTG